MINRRLLIVKLVLGLLLVPLLSIPTQAQTPTPTPPVTAAAPDPAKDLWQTVNKLIRDARSWLVPIAVLIIIYAGILYETSAMNPALQGTAKTILWTTISGLIFLILYPTIIGILSDKELIPHTDIDTSGNAGS